MSAPKNRTPGRRLRWVRVECITCDGCGWLANDSEGTPWYRVREKWPDLIEHARGFPRKELRPFVCTWCAGLGWVARPLSPVRKPR